MKKDFWKWHQLKVNLNERTGAPYFYEREVWFCSMGLNIGYEQDGGINEKFERPVLIFKKFNQKTFWGIPLTSKNKIGFYYCPIEVKGRTRLLIMSQLKLIDSKRLSKKLTVISPAEFDRIKENLKQIIK